MTDNQTDRFAMAQTTLGVLDQYRAVWEGAPDDVEDRDELEALLATVRRAAQRQADPTKAATQVKDELRTGVRDAAVALAAAVHSWATRRGRADVAARVGATKTEVLAYRDLALAEWSELVTIVAQEHLDGDDGLVARTSVTAEEVAALDALDDQFAAALDTPRAAIIARGRATGDIAAALSRVHRLLTDHLDVVAERHKTTAPEFAKDYAAARNLVSRGRTPTPDPDA